MHRKVIAEWDDVGNGVYVNGVYVGATNQLDAEKCLTDTATADPTAQLIALKNAGFTVEEIVTLDQRGLLRGTKS